MAVDNILDMRYFRDVLPQLRERQLGLTLFYETKANLTKEQVKLLRDAGVLAIQPGVESLSTHVLQLMRKGVTALQNIQLLKWCRQYGVTVAWNLLYGFPGETAADYAAIGQIDRRRSGTCRRRIPSVPFGWIASAPYFNEAAVVRAGQRPADGDVSTALPAGRGPAAQPGLLLRLRPRGRREPRRLPGRHRARWSSGGGPAPAA